MFRKVLNISVVVISPEWTKKYHGNEIYFSLRSILSFHLNNSPGYTSGYHISGRLTQSEFLLLLRTFTKNDELPVVVTTYKPHRALRSALEFWDPKLFQSSGLPCYRRPN